MKMMMRTRNRRGGASDASTSFRDSSSSSCCVGGDDCVREDMNMRREREKSCGGKSWEKGKQCEEGENGIEDREAVEIMNERTTRRSTRLQNMNVTCRTTSGLIARATEMVRSESERECIAEVSAADDEDHFVDLADIEALTFSGQLTEKQLQQPFVGVSEPIDITDKMTVDENIHLIKGKRKVQVLEENEDDHEVNSAMKKGKKDMSIEGTDINTMQLSPVPVEIENILASNTKKESDNFISCGPLRELPEELLEDILMLSRPRDLASLQATCSWMRASSVIDRVVTRRLDSADIVLKENESMTMLLEFLQRARSARILGTKIGLGSYHSALLLQLSEEEDEEEDEFESSVHVSNSDREDETYGLSLYTCGRGFHGQLGHGRFEDTCEPTSLDIVNGDSDDIQASVQVNVMSDSITAVACGGSHTAAITESGKLLTWGLASSGELGHGGWTPIEMASPRIVNALKDFRIISIAAGSNHTMAVSSCGKVWTCGRGRHGQLGHGHFHDAGPLQQVTALQGRFIVGATAGSKHSVVYAADGAIYSWGSNVYGQLGHGVEIANMEPGLAWPRRIQDNLRSENVISVAAGGHHTLAVTDSGKLFAFGRGRHGALGLGDTADYFFPELVDVIPSYMREINEPEPRVAAVAAGSNHSIVLTGMGNVLTCGACNYGQLGTGDMTSLTMFSEVESLKRLGRLNHISGIAAGDNHSAAVDTDGNVYVWGRGDWGQLGNGTTISQWYPERLMNASMPIDLQMLTNSI